MAQQHASTNKTLREAFSEYRSDPRRRLHVKFRRERARQLRDLLSDPDALDLKTFNSDVWVGFKGAYLGGKEIGFPEFTNASSEELARFESALEAGELELHGNFVWEPPAKIYGAMLKVDDEQKIEACVKPCAY